MSRNVAVLLVAMPSTVTLIRKAKTEIRAALEELNLDANIEADADQLLQNAESHLAEAAQLISQARTEVKEMSR
jgi:hypothetical protein